MTLSPVKPGGWALNEVLTSAQMTALQDELLKAVDGTDGGVYTLSTDLEFQGAKLIATGGIDIGDLSEVIDNSIFRITSGSSLVFQAGALLPFQGDMSVVGVGHVDLEVDGSIRAEATSSIRLQAADALTVESGASIQVENGAAINIDDAATLNVTGSTTTGFRVPLAPIALADTGGSVGYENSASDGIDQFLQTSVPAELVLPLRLSAGDVLDELTVFLEGGTGAGHGVFLPANPTAISVVRVNLDGNVSTVITLVDPSASAAGYDAFHSVIISGIAHTVIASETLYVLITGESGLNSIANTTMIRAVLGEVQLKNVRAPFESM